MPSGGKNNLELSYSGKTNRLGELARLAPRSAQAGALLMRISRASGQARLHTFFIATSIERLHAGLWYKSGHFHSCYCTLTRKSTMRKSPGLFVSQPQLLSGCPSRSWAATRHSQSLKVLADAAFSLSEPLDCFIPLALLPLPSLKGAARRALTGNLRLQSLLLFLATQTTVLQPIPNSIMGLTS
jgi:hypothetical protein